MKKVIALMTLLVLVATVSLALAGTRFGGTHTKRPRIVNCFVNGDIVKMRKRDCRDHGGRVIRSSEVVKFKKMLERRGGM